MTSKKEKAQTEADRVQSNDVLHQERQEIETRLLDTYLPLAERNAAVARLQHVISALNRGGVKEPE